mgnify:CR=1 FL=1
MNNHSAEDYLDKLLNSVNDEKEKREKERKLWELAEEYEDEESLRCRCRNDNTIQEQRRVLGLRAAADNARRRRGSGSLFHLLPGSDGSADAPQQRSELRL